MSLKDKELYTETVVAAYKRLMDIVFYDAAADTDDESDKEEDK